MNYLRQSPEKPVFVINFFQSQYFSEHVCF